MSFSSGLVIATYGANSIVRTSEGVSYTATKRKKLMPLCVGDTVHFSLDQDSDHHLATVEHIEPRHHTFCMPHAHGIKTIANGIDSLWIVISPVPNTPAETIDRYLIAASADNLPVLIIRNKSDLENAAFDARLAGYETMGIPIIRVSSHTPESYDQLLPHIRNKRNMLLGQSGAGKSTLIKHLSQGEGPKIGDLAKDDRFGRHTTTSVTLFDTKAEGGSLVDTPGTRQWDIRFYTPDQLRVAFPEILQHAHHCRFRDCVHQNTPGCAVLKALEDGNILPERLAHFLSFLNTPTE